MSFISGTAPDFLPTIPKPPHVDRNEDMGFTDNSYSKPLSDTQSNSALLKQRLEMYWAEMAKYQNDKMQHQVPVSSDITSTPSYQDLIKQQSPEVIEQAKKFVKTLLDNDNIQSNLNEFLPKPSVPPQVKPHQGNPTSMVLSPNNVTNDTYLPNAKPPGAEKPLDLTVPLTCKKRPASDPPSKAAQFRNAHLQSRTVQPTQENKNSPPIENPTSQNPPIQNNQETVITLPPGLTQPQVSHLQQWLVSLPNKGMYPMSMLQQQSINQEDLPAKRQRTEAYSPLNYNNQMTQYNGNHVFTMPKIPQANYRPGQQFSPQMPMQHMPPNNQKSPGSAMSPSTNQNSPPNSNGKRYKRYAKPPYSYVSLISLSILSSPEKKLRLSQILKRISEMFPFFNGSYQGWRDSVRHNLSQNECFVKVLKNPFRPTAKGNYWTINLSSIPHELLLRQNTLVSRYAQDSGFRYRKDLSEVFDLSTGEIKVAIPNHLLNQSAIRTHRSPLVDDPAAVMEAILLEETCDDDRCGGQSNLLNDKMVFTLQDLFNQDESEDEARSRRNARNQKSTASANIAMMNPALASYINQAKSPYATQARAQNMKDAAVNPSHVPMAPGIDRQLLAFQMLQTAMSNNMMMGSQPQPQNNAAAIMAAQNALLSKALTSKMSTNPMLQNMFYAANQMNMSQKLQTISPPNYSPKVNGDASVHGTDEQRNSSTPNSDKSLSSEEPTKRKKQRKGLPMRRSSVDENDNELNNVPISANSTSPTPSRPSSWDAEKQRSVGSATSFGITTSSSHEDSFDSEEQNNANNAMLAFQNIPLYPSSIHSGKMT